MHRAAKYGGRQVERLDMDNIDSERAAAAGIPASLHMGMTDWLVVER